MEGSAFAILCLGALYFVEPLFVFTAPRCLALRRAVLPERRTGVALGDMDDFSDLLDTGAATRGA
jgi:hypothetical protein